MILGGQPGYTTTLEGACARAARAAMVTGLRQRVELCRCHAFGTHRHFVVMPTDRPAPLTQVQRLATLKHYATAGIEAAEKVYEACS